MKNISTTCAVLALIFVSAFTALHGQGRLEIIGGDSFSWGTVPPGDVSTVVRVRNSAATGDLKISNVQVACHCTVVAPMSKSVLKPGDTASFALKIDMRINKGPVRKIITIYSSDTLNPARQMDLNADVKPAFDFEPAQYLLYPDGIVNEEGVAAVKVTNATDSVITFSAPQFMEGGSQIKARFETTTARKLKPRETMVLKVYFTPLFAGPLTGTVRLKTSLETMPIMDFAVYGNASVGKKKDEVGSK